MDQACSRNGGPDAVYIGNSGNFSRRRRKRATRWDRPTDDACEAEPLSATTSAAVILQVADSSVKSSCDDLLGMMIRLNVFPSASLRHVRRRWIFAVMPFPASCADARNPTVPTGRPEAWIDSNSNEAIQTVHSPLIVRLSAVPFKQHVLRVQRANIKMLNTLLKKNISGSF